VENWNLLTTGSTTTNLTYTTGTSGYYIQPLAPSLPAAPQRPLDWLDAEVERTCALARSAA